MPGGLGYHLPTTTVPYPSEYPFSLKIKAAFSIESKGDRMPLRRQTEDY